MMTYLLPGNSSMAWNLVSGCDSGHFGDHTNLHFYPSDDDMIEGARGLPATCPLVPCVAGGLRAQASFRILPK